MRLLITIKANKPTIENVHRTAWLKWRPRVWWIALSALTTTVTLASIPTPLASSTAARPPLRSTPQSLGLTDTLHLLSRAAIAVTTPLDDWLHEREKLDTAEQRPTRGPAHPRSFARAAAPIAMSSFNGHPTRLLQPIPGQALTIRADGQGNLQELIYRAEPNERLRLTRALRGLSYWRERRAVDIRLAYVTGHVDGSLFEDGKNAGLSDPLIRDLTEIFGWDIDFALDVRAGDRFAVIHEQKYWNGQKIADGEILAAEYTNQGHVHRAIGVRGADGRLAYYTPTGRSLKRTFLRTPVKFSRVTSLFSKARYHPVLKEWRAHNGVDYSAPVGTPVQATASGRVVSVGWKGSYGKTVVLDHDGLHSTLYAHLSRYQPELKTGQYVKQGAIIGYVGHSGLTTGPHLHYELQVNGSHQNPLTFEFPDGTYIAAPRREEFWRAARVWVTRLDFINGRSVAVLNDQMVARAGQ
jgi:murein DD-endopeptidase MepM/ murein hydrolase activator NlpD